jgi:hypothetical protein
MLLARALVLMLMGLAIGSFIGYILTGRTQFKDWGLRLLRWTLFAALVFFGTLIVSRLL